MDSWNLSHPLDISGWSYRAYLLQLCSEADDTSHHILDGILQIEFGKIHASIQVTPENDAMWYYRQQVVQLFTKVTSSLKEVFKIDREAYIDLKLCDLSDSDLKSYSNVVIPPRYSGAWAALLYKRYLRWIAQTVDFSH